MYESMIDIYGGSSFIDNEAAYGGGIYFAYYSYLDIDGKCKIDGNTASKQGGGLCCSINPAGGGSSVYLEDSTVSNNVCKDANYAAGLYVFTDYDKVYEEQIPDTSIELITSKIIVTKEKPIILTSLED